MSKNLVWDEARIKSYITNSIQENSKLEYKGPEALQITDVKKKEISKDVSSIANAAGGIIIYGIEEFSDKSKEHLPERISPLNRCDISREWLDQVISTNINRPIKDLIIYPIDIGTNKNDVVYVIEIPQSTTAHQAKDGRYYRRRNTTTQILEHYEIIDILNRTINPDVNVEFGWKYDTTKSAQLHTYNLIIKIINAGPLVEHFQLDFIFHYCVEFSYNNRVSKLKTSSKYQGEFVEHVIINSENVLFPKQEIDFTNEHRISYKVDNHIYHNYEDNSPIISWILYADQMEPKKGIVEFQELNNF